MGSFLLLPPSDVVVVVVVADTIKEIASANDSCLMADFLRAVDMKGPAFQLDNVNLLLQPVVQLLLRSPYDEYAAPNLCAFPRAMLSSSFLVLLLCSQPCISWSTFTGSLV